MKGRSSSSLFASDAFVAPQIKPRLAGPSHGATVLLVTHTATHRHRERRAVCASKDLNPSTAHHLDVKDVASRPSRGPRLPLCVDVDGRSGCRSLSLCYT